MSPCKRTRGYNASVESFAMDMMSSMTISSHALLTDKSAHDCQPAAKDVASIQSAVDEMEAKIMERVSRLTISTEESPPSETQEATEVSFTLEEVSSGSTATAQLEAPLASSPIRTRKKRAPADCMTTPNRTTQPSMFATPQISNCDFGGGCRKKRRPGTLADAPRLPSSDVLESPGQVAHRPRFSPFQPTIYDQRLERLASRHRPLPLLSVEADFDDVPFLAPTSQPSSQGSSRSTSPIDFENMPPTISWMAGCAPRKRSRRRFRPRSQVPFVPCLSPRQQDLTPLESLAVSIEASYSPIMPIL